MRFSRIVMLACSVFLGSHARIVEAACLPAPSGLIAWWPGDGHPGDVIGGQHATKQGGIGFSPGFIRGSFLFDGVDDYLVVGDPAELNLVGDFSIVAWVRRTGDLGDNGKHLISRRSQNCGQEAYQVAVKETAHLSAVAGAATVTSSLQVPVDTWTFIAVAYHAGGSPTLDFYVNDQQQLGAISAPPVGNIISPEVWIGQANGCPADDLWRGGVDELQIYDRALSSTEIEALFGANDGVCLPPPIPAAGSWGIVLLGLGALCGATLILRSARYLRPPC